MPKKINYEEAITKLENIIEQLEDASTPIDHSIKLYKEGIDLAKFCSDKLTSLEGEVAILKKTSDGLFKKEIFQNNE